MGFVHNLTIPRACFEYFTFSSPSVALQVFAAAGAVNHDELVKEVEKSFKNLSTDPTSAADLVEKEPAFFTGSEVSFMSFSGEVLAMILKVYIYACLSPI